MMKKNKFAKVWALGLMSGTSLDGIDAALVQTDGIEIGARGPWATEKFTDEDRHLIREAVYQRGDLPSIENLITIRHAELVKKLLKENNISAKDIEVIGFHGQTISHRPSEGITWQMGNGSLLAEMTGIDVIGDFRRRDVAAGGQGAPLVPLYHAALSKSVELPVVILNLGGIANVTWVGRSEAGGNELLGLDILAFDTGPGNVLLNEWMLKHTGSAIDENGNAARAGKVDDVALAALMKNPFFDLHPPKSLDRHYFTLDAISHLSTQDGAATLTAFTAQAVKAGVHYFPVPVKRWYVSGGGRHNSAMMETLKRIVGEVYPVETLGWEGDALEAQAFGFLAVRSLYGLPITLPTTTGVLRATTGGGFFAGRRSLSGKG